jgi:short-subunit dehydrogenase
MKLSAMTSEDAAEQTLRGLEASGTYIVIGSQARLIYRIKRFAPNLWLRLAPKVARKAFAKADAAALS